MEKKRIIVCCDGTWNKPGAKDQGKIVKTNVELTYRYVLDRSHNVKQVKLYDPGIGSTAPGMLKSVFEGMTGEGIDKNIKDVYTFLMLNYEKEDEIFLFGFSRGAYTVRSLTGFIRNCGLLRPENLHLVDKAYEMYRDKNQYSHPDSDLMYSFRQKYCFDTATRIKFIGVWDTVGSLGVPFRNKYNRERYSFHDVKISSDIDYAYHAIAVDERRKLFMPSLWKLSNSVIEKKVNQVMEQRWFPGVHSDVGGGYKNHKLSDIALVWLLEKAASKEVGLQIDMEALKKHQPDYTERLHDSYTWYYKLWYPRIRHIGKDEHSNQVLDSSVINRFKNKSLRYTQPNLTRFDLDKIVGDYKIEKTWVR